MTTQKSDIQKELREMLKKLFKETCDGYNGEFFNRQDMKEHVGLQLLLNDYEQQILGLFKRIALECVRVNDCNDVIRKNIEEKFR